MIYCNYDTQDVIDITLDDLQGGGRNHFDYSEFRNRKYFKRKMTIKAKIAVEQLQLGTQRIR